MTEDENLKVGDVVWLNSGSPPLTVTRISNYPFSTPPWTGVTVEWISDTERAVHTSEFNKLCLSKTPVEVGLGQAAAKR